MMRPKEHCMRATSIRYLLMAVVILLFAICFALSSTGMGLVTLGLAFIGLCVGIFGFFARAE